jgi:hypothetical protein
MIELVFILNRKALFYLQDIHEKKLVWMAWAIMIGIIGPVISFVGPNLIHELTLKTRNTLYIDTPMLANFLFLGGVIALVIFCVFMYWGKRYMFITVPTMLVSVLLFFLSSNVYLLMTKDSIAEQSLFSFTRLSYGWDEVTAGEMIITDPKSGLGTLALTFDDGYEMRFGRNGYLMENLGMINQLLKENGVVYKIIIPDGNE